MSKKAYLFGAGINGYGVAKFFGDIFINVIDNDPLKKGTKFCGYTVVGFEDFLEFYKGETVIVSTYSRSEDVVKQLRKSGISDIYVAPLMQYGFWKDCDEIIDNYLMLELPKIVLWGSNPYSDLLSFTLKKRNYKGVISVIGKENTIELDKGDMAFFTDMDFVQEERINAERWIDLTKQRFIYKKSLVKFKNCHKGKRCFIIGNGPSLSGGDLNLLGKSGEICFGCNSIFEICKMIDWKPNYYVVADYMVWRQVADQFMSYIQEVDNSFIADFYYEDQDIPDNCSRFNLLPFKYERGYSEDIACSIFSGGNVVYASIQIATYMGFEEIYLLGVDCNTLGHFYQRKIIPDNINGSWDADTWTVSYWIDAFSIARTYADTHNIMIYNATRGGALEVFERVDFDSLDFLNKTKGE